MQNCTIAFNRLQVQPQSDSKTFTETECTSVHYLLNFYIECISQKEIVFYIFFYILNDFIKNFY